MTDHNFYIWWENVLTNLNCAWKSLTIITADFVLQVFPVAMQLHPLSELVLEALLVGLHLLESESHCWCPNQTLQNVGGVGFAGQQLHQSWWHNMLTGQDQVWWHDLQGMMNRFGVVGGRDMTFMCLPCLRVYRRYLASAKEVPFVCPFC